MSVVRNARPRLFTSSIYFFITKRRKKSEVEIVDIKQESRQQNLNAKVLGILEVKNALLLNATRKGPLPELGAVPVQPEGFSNIFTLSTLDQSFFFF